MITNRRKKDMQVFWLLMVRALGDKKNLMSVRKAEGTEMIESFSVVFHGWGTGMYGWWRREGNAWACR